MTYHKSTVLALLATTALSACGGGSTGGNPYTAGVSSTPSVPSSSTVAYWYVLPTLQGTHDPLSGDANTAYSVWDSHISDIDGDGASDDIIFAGRQTATTDYTNWVNSRMTMMSFEDGRLVDKTAQWFNGTDNIIAGTEPDVEFTDFFKTGRSDMFVSHSTDNAVVRGPAYVFRNTGSNFDRIEIPTVGIWSHDSDVGDLNNDTYDDIIMTDYGPRTTIALNNTVDGFTTYIDLAGEHSHLQSGGSAIAIGNFMNDGGNNEIIVSDASCPYQFLNVAGCDKNNQTKMFGVSWANDRLTYTFIKDLPQSANSFTNNHNVRVVNYDFNEDGNDDVMVFARPFNWSIEESDIQFLQNNGSGDFNDVTSTILSGFNQNTHSTYQPKFFDINADGREDILLSGSDYAGTNNSHQFLMKQADGTYIGAHQNVLTNFVKDAQDIQGVTTGGTTVNVFEGDDGNKYLVTYVPFNTGGDRQMAVFMSSLNGETIAAGTAKSMLQNQWSYLSDDNATKALVDTSTAYAGGSIIDVNKAYQPLGGLSINGASLNGSITGVNIGNIAGVATDTIGRGYTVSLGQASVKSDATMYNTLNSTNGATFNTGTISFTVDPVTDKIALAKSVYSKGNFNYSVHASNFDRNPWVNFNGVWGTVNSSTVIDNVASYTKDKLVFKGSLMHVNTDITPGLVTSMSSQTGVWAEASYTNGGFRAFAGIHPVALSGSVSANIGSSIDNNGNMQYTQHTFGMPSNVDTYARLEYTNGGAAFGATMSQAGPTTANVSYTINW